LSPATRREHDGTRELDSAGGDPSPLGVTWIESEQGYNFALYSKHAERFTLLLYRGDDVANPVPAQPFDHLWMINACWEDLVFTVQEGQARQRVIDTAPDSPADFCEPGAAVSLTSAAHLVRGRSVWPRFARGDEQPERGCPIGACFCRRRPQARCAGLPHASPGRWTEESNGKGTSVRGGGRDGWIAPARAAVRAAAVFPCPAGARSGLDPAPVRWYEAFAQWKTAVRVLTRVTGSHENHLASLFQ
jgi:hypothetical protein